MIFLRDQLSDASVRQKLQSLVEMDFGAGYTLDIKTSKDVPAGGVSAQEIAQKKEEKKQKDLVSQVSEHPKVKAAAQVFKGQIKTIKETP